MNRIQLLNSTVTGPKAKSLSEIIRKKLGFVPDSFRFLSKSPAVMHQFLSLREGLADVSLPASLGDRIAIAVSEIQFGGDLLRGSSVKRSGVVLSLVRFVLLERGPLDHENLRATREAGLSDGEIAEIVATLALTLTNYLSEIADAAISFPMAFPRTFLEETPMPAAA